MVFNDSTVRVSERKKKRLYERANTNTRTEKRKRNEKTKKWNNLFIVYSLWILELVRTHSYITWINTKLSSNYDDYFHISEFTFSPFVFHFSFCTAFFSCIFSFFFNFFSFLHLFDLCCIALFSFPLSMCALLCIALHSIRCKFKKWISTASKRPCLKTLKIASQCNGIQIYIDVSVRVCVFVLFLLWCKSVSHSSIVRNCALCFIEYETKFYFWKKKTATTKK